MVSLFSLHFAVKSILRKPKKNFGTILAVSLGVTLLIGVQVGSTGIEQALGSAWYSTAGETDMAVYDVNNPIFPGNVSDYIIENTKLDDLDVMSKRLDQFLTFYHKGVIQNRVDLQGLQPQHQNDFGGFRDQYGNLLDATVLERNNTIFVNDYLANKMGLKVGDVISSSMPDGMGGSSSLNLEVIAIVDSQFGRATEYFYVDNPIAYINIELIQSKLALPLQDYISGIVFKFNTVDRSLQALDIDNQYFPGKELIQENLEGIELTLNSLGNTYRVFSGRIQIAESIKDDISGITSVLTLFVFILNLVGLLLIVNVQSMSLDDRRYQTAVLRAMGSNKYQIFRVFLIESAIVGIIGAILGSVFGIFYGQFVESTIVDIFSIPESSESLSLDSSLLMTAMIFGILLSVMTAVLPSWFAASRSITNELRGIEEEKVKQRSRRPFVIGLATLISGLLAAQNVGEFWTDEGWKSFEDTTNILLALGFSIFGLGLLVSYINKRLGYNLSAVSIYGLAMYSLFDRLDVVETGNGNTWLLVIMLYLVLGSVMLVVVNFDIIMDLLNKFMSFNPKMRAISQVSTKAMIAKKGRLAMVFTVLTLVLVLNLFVGISAHSITETNVDSYAVRSDGIDIVINSEVPNVAIKTLVGSLEGVQDVFAFRSYTVPMFTEDPTQFSAEQLTEYIRFRRVIEFNQSQIRPSGVWDDRSFVPHVFKVNNLEVNGHQYQHEIGLSRDQNQALAQQLLTDFWANSQVEYEKEIFNEVGELVSTNKTSGAMIIGDFFSDQYEDLYFQDKHGEVIQTYSAGAVFTMGGDYDMFGGAMLVTPEIFSQLTAAEQIQEPNLFLVRSSLTYHQVEKTQKLAIQIEKTLNDLDDPISLSSQQGILLGATTRIVQEEISKFWEREAQFWDFLNIFAALGLIIGSLGMIIIAVRSVQERTREIGMMRAIGFQRRTVVFTVGFELIFVSAVGLIAGILNGIFMTKAFVGTLLEVPVAYPIGLLLVYIFGLLGIALFAGLIPGIRASRIPASEALRYTG